MGALEIVQKVDRKAQAIARGTGEWGHNIITEMKTSFGPSLNAEEVEFLEHYVAWRRSNPIVLTPVKA